MVPFPEITVFFIAQGLKHRKAHALEWSSMATGAEGLHTLGQFWFIFDDQDGPIMGQAWSSEPSCPRLWREQRFLMAQRLWVVQNGIRRRGRGACGACGA